MDMGKVLGVVGVSSLAATGALVMYVTQPKSAPAADLPVPVPARGPAPSAAVEPVVNDEIAPPSELRTVDPETLDREGTRPASTEEQSTQSDDEKSKLAEVNSDNQWYALNMNAHHCFPVDAVFGVSSPYLVQQQYNQNGIPLEITKNEGAGEEGSIVTLQSPSDALSGPMAFVKGETACIVAMKIIQAKTGDNSPSD